MSKAPIKREPLEDFENLVRNGVDFLKKAISQLDSDPKHSVINFYTAVEIFLKAPLVHEHWTLVVGDRDFNRSKYEAGDFLSVNFEDTCKRLATALGKQLKPSAKEAFDKVRKHRNRMVHFYHDGIDGLQRDEIKLEQAQAWFELNRFIFDTWRDKFAPFRAELLQMEQHLIAYNHYAQAKYESLKSKVEAMKIEGKSFEVCSRCSTPACQVEEEVERLTSHHCLVCFLHERKVQVACPECHDDGQQVTAYELFSCKICGHEIVKEEAIFDLLDQCGVRGTKDDLDSDTPANCDECQGYQTVCDFENGYLCSNCFTFFDTLNQCAYCNDYMTGDPKGTYAHGCEHCDGMAGRYANE
ncbi:hsdR [Candidatus Parcubacteria bacterium]|nr:MAG: hsdR [Candidatus Parcubacteria bacterium]